MAQSTFAERRTRSQLALPDDLLFHLPQRSPMKGARLAHRSHVQEGQESRSTQEEYPMSNVPTEMATESRTKRSMSPIPESGTLERHSEPPPGREVKRAKRDHGGVAGSDVAPRRKGGPAVRLGTHMRNASDPSASRTRRSARQRSTTPASSTGASTLSGPDLPPIAERAQSVPLFPTLGPLPLIDLKNPPTSPRRARLQSPKKEGLKLVTNFAPTKLDVALDETSEKMDVEDDKSAPTEQEVRQDPEQISPIPHSISKENDIIIQFVNPDSPSPTPAMPHGSYESATATPTRDHPISSGELSPLTPVSDTPYPFKSKSVLDNSKEHNESMKVADHKTLEVASSSRHPSLHPSHPKPLDKQQSTSANSRRLLTVVGRGLKSSGTDVFSVMMRASQEKKKLTIGSSQDKAKQKTSVDSVSSVKDPLRTTVRGDTWKEIRPEVTGPRNKLKARMRPRERPRIETTPNLTVLEEDEADEETAPKQSVVDLWDPVSLVLPADRPPPTPVEPPTFEARRGLTMPSTSSDEDKERAATAISETAHELTRFVTSPEEKSSQPIPEPPMVVSSAGVLAHSEVPPAEAGPADLPEAERPEDQPYASAREQGASVDGSTEMICDQHDQRTESSSNAAREDSIIDVPVVSTLPIAETTPEAKKSRSPRKKVPTTIVPVGRVTRSAASRLKVKEPSISRSAAQSSIPVTPRTVRVKPASTFSLTGRPEQATTGSAPQGDPPNIAPTAASALPRTPTRQRTPSRKPIGSNYARPTTSSAAKVTKTPKLSRSSPAKMTRSPSVPSSRLPTTSSRLFSTASAGHWASGAPSSLSTLSSALEKLRMPPPQRPNTTLGFNTAPGNSNTLSSATQDSSSSDRSSLGKGLPPSSTNLRRRSNSFTIPSSSSTVAAKPQPVVQQPISMFFTSKQDPVSKDTNGLTPSGTKPSIRRKLFGVGSGGVFGMGMRSRAAKVSRKTSLPMVAGSPVKGGEPMNTYDHSDNDDAIVIDDHDDDSGKDRSFSLEIVTDNVLDTADLGTDEYLVPIAADSPKGGRKKDKDGSSWEQSSRRASLASLALTESLSALPLQSLMGPPTMIPKHGRVTRSTSNSHASTSQTTSPSDKIGDISGGASKAQTKASSANVSLKFMKDCVVFVDVRTDDGDDAGSLFVEMLEGAGAKVLARVGQSCTHIIFKNGLLSTLSRYRMLHDPKPLVVGIAWVVECVEQRKHIDEVKFLVDPTDMNFANANKRRKSLLPKLVPHEVGNTGTPDINNSHEDGDQSMDGSNSSLILDDLPPLERARRRVPVGTRS